MRNYLYPLAQRPPGSFRCPQTCALPVHPLPTGPPSPRRPRIVARSPRFALSAMSGSWNPVARGLFRRASSLGKAGACGSSVLSVRGPVSRLCRVVVPHLFTFLNWFPVWHDGFHRTRHGLLDVAFGVPLRPGSPSVPPAGSPHPRRHAPVVSLTSRGSWETLGKEPRRKPTLRLRQGAWVTPPPSPSK